MRMFKSFRSVTICCAVLSVFCALLGILASILAGTPVGSTIVAVQIGAFGRRGWQAQYWEVFADEKTIVCFC